ncbi:MAG: metallophosphoesterase [Candidatus Schekmanbacteria bacterium]|nr:metallophosphoesterase [Candidatus Schekmanbacteria bacterium]
MTQRWIRALTALLVGGGIVAWLLLPVRFAVERPRLGIPAVVAPGETFSIVVRGSVPFWSGVEKAEIVSSAPIDTQNARAPRQRHVLVLTGLRLTGVHADIKAVVPAGVPDGPYDLVVSGRQRIVVRPRSLFVQKSFPDRFSLAQMADLPELTTDDGVRRLNAIVDEINVVNPEAVLLTGDLAYGGAWHSYDRLVRALLRLRAPVIAAPGNHEYEGWAGYLSYFGSPYHAVDLGKLRILSLNSGHGRDQLTQSQFRWLRDNLPPAGSGLTVIQIHHPPFPERSFRVNDLAFAALASERGVPLVLHGHWHADGVFDGQGRRREDTTAFPGTHFAVTTAAGRALRRMSETLTSYHGYRIVRIEAGQVVSYTYDVDGDGVRDAAASVPLGMIHVEAPEPGTVRVKNKLNEALPNARVRIAAGADAGPVMSASRGTVAEVIELGETRFFEVVVDIPARSEVVISLLPAQLAEQP